MKTKKILSYCTVALVGIGPLDAQDGHLAQFEMAPVMLNPALTGMFEQRATRQPELLQSPADGRSRIEDWRPASGVEAREDRREKVVGREVARAWTRQRGKVRDDRVRTTGVTVALSVVRQGERTPHIAFVPRQPREADVAEGAIEVDHPDVDASGANDLESRSRVLRRAREVGRRLSVHVRPKQRAQRRRDDASRIVGRLTIGLDDPCQPTERVQCFSTANRNGVNDGSN